MVDRIRIRPLRALRELNFTIVCVRLGGWLTKGIEHFVDLNFRLFIKANNFF